MIDIHVTIDIDVPPEAVFDLIADIANYSRWLPPSKTYSEVANISDSPIRQGTTYLDKNSMTVLRGEITAHQRPAQIAFHEATAKQELDVTIDYRLSSTADGTHLERTAAVKVTGLLRLAQPILARRLTEENRRILSAMKTYLEAGNV